MAERRDDEPDWVGKLFLVILGAILFIIVAYLCAHSCQAGYTWDSTLNCCVGSNGTCYAPTTPSNSTPSCNNDGTCNGVETCSTCPFDCGACVVTPPCKGSYQPCGPGDTCCGLGSVCDDSHCCPASAPDWDIAKGCCVDLSGVCSCYTNGFAGCTADAECCSGNCNPDHCCPVIGGVPATWNPINLCCEIGGACVCMGRTGDCSVYGCCGSLACVGPGTPHCCDLGEEWNSTSSCCANATTHICNCLRTAQTCTMNDQCCGSASGSVCDDSHCCPASAPDWDSTAGCCMTSSGVCLAEGSSGEWFCDGNPICSVWSCNGQPQNPFPACSCNCTAVTCADPLFPILDPSDCSCDAPPCLPPVCLNGGVSNATCGCDCTNALCPAQDSTLILLGSYTHLQPIAAGTFISDVKTFLVPPDVYSGELRIPAGPTGYIDDSGWITLNGQVIYYYPPPTCGAAYTAVRLPIALNPGAVNTLELFAKDVCTGSVGYKNVNIYGRGTVPASSSDCSCSCAGITCPSGAPRVNTCTCPCTLTAADCNGGTPSTDPPCTCDCSTSPACGAAQIKDPYNCKCISDCATTCLNGGIQDPFPTCTCDCTGIICLDPDSTVVSLSTMSGGISGSSYYALNFLTPSAGADTAKLVLASISRCGTVSINGFNIPIKDNCVGNLLDCSARDTSEDIDVLPYMYSPGVMNVLQVHAIRPAYCQGFMLLAANIKINIGKAGPTTRPDCGCDCTGATCTTPMNPDCTCS